MYDLRERMKTSEFKDVKLEKLLIAGILKYEKIVVKCIEEFSSNFFSSNRYKWIYEQIISFYDRNSTIMDLKGFEICVGVKKEKERRMLIKLWNTIYKLRSEIKRSTCLAVMEKMRKLYHARLMEAYMADAVACLSKVQTEGDMNIEKAKKIFVDLTPKLEDRNENIITVDPLATYEEFKKHHLKVQENPSKYRGVLTGIIPLDNIMGGLRPSEFGLVTAGTGKGKSILLGDFAYNCFLSTGDSLYVTIEMPWTQIRQRFFCRISGIIYDRFRDYELGKDDWSILDRKVEKFLKQHDNKYHILDIPRSCTVSTLQHEIENHIKKFKEPKLIIIDYMNIMLGGMEWIKQLEIAIDIKQKIARYFKIATWSANQLAGAKHEKEHINISDFGFAKNIADNVDVGIGLAESEVDEDEENKDKIKSEHELFNIDFTKTRDFVGKSITIHADRSRMTFSSQSPEHSKALLYKDKQIGGNIKT